MVANAAQRACRSTWREAAWQGAIGAAVQLVYNNNNELIAQQGENKTKVKSSKKVLKKFYKNSKQFWKRFKIFLKSVIKVSKKV